MAALGADRGWVLQPFQPWVGTGRELIPPAPERPCTEILAFYLLTTGNLYTTRYIGNFMLP
jgi:hypothetical protein